MAASAAFALKPGVWFRRGRLLIVSPNSLGTACPLSGRNSTYRPVQISETGSVRDWLQVFDHCAAIQCVLEKGRPGEVYNVGASDEKTNLEVVQTICAILDE